MILAFLAVLVAATPQGSPICQINESGVVAGHGSAADASLGFAVKMTASSGGMDFTLTNPAVTTFNGILMYVSSRSAPTAHLGSFAPSTGLVAMSQGLCSAAKVTGEPMATLTHSGPEGKELSPFVWTGDMADDLQLNIIIGAQIGKSSGLKSAPRWQVLNLPIEQPAAAASPSPVKALAPTQTAAPEKSRAELPTISPKADMHAGMPPTRKVIKCRPNAKKPFVYGSGAPAY